MAKALHLQIEQQLLSEIHSGKYPVGSQIPTENEFASQLGVSRPTVRQALNSLAYKGYLTRVKGRGTFVAQAKILHESTSFITSYHAESQKSGSTLRTKVLDVQVRRSEDYVALKLGIHPGEKVTQLTRLRSLENGTQQENVVYTVLYVPCKLFPDMETIDFTDLSFYDVLSSRDLSVAHASKKLEVIPAPAEVAANLKISPFEPVIYIRSVGYTGFGTAIEYSESYYPAGNSSFQIEVDHR